jgi:hypothetical protein
MCVFVCTCACLQALYDTQAYYTTHTSILTLASMQPGVQGCADTEVVAGMPALAPFAAPPGLWDAFKAAGGVTLLCTTCVKHRKLEQTDMAEGAVLFK